MTNSLAPNLLPLFLILSSLLATACAGNFYRDVDITWGGQRANILQGGQMLTLSLDEASGSGFQSKNEFLFGRFDVQLKLIPGNSAGTVTTFYLSSQGPKHDEIDFEFLGNLSGDPYTLQTNVYSQGVGSREQQFHLWFDPTTAFHTYTIVWNPQRIIFLVDNSPIRVFNNYESRGVAFPNMQPMRMYSTLWDGDNWATQGGRVKTDWSQSPFVASYRNLNANACVSSAQEISPCSTNGTIGSPSGPNGTWYTQALNGKAISRMRWLRQRFMIYDYCTDLKRFPHHRPRECRGRKHF